MVLLDERAAFSLGAPATDSAPYGYDVEIAPEVVDGKAIYVARHPDLPRCFAQGDSVEEARANLDLVREEFLADMKAAGIEVPPAKIHPRTMTLRVEPQIEPQIEAPPGSRVKWRVTPPEELGRRR